MELDPRTCEWTLETGLLAGSRMLDPVAAAAEVLERLQTVLPNVGAAVCAWDPVAHDHVAVSNAAYPDAVLRYLNEGFVKRDPAYRMMHDRQVRPLRWRDTPFDYRRTFSVEAVFEPAGYEEGMSTTLFAPDGRYTGTFHVSTEAAQHPSDDAREAVHRLRPVLGMVVDRMRTPAWLAASLDADANAVFVTRAGEVLQLPGRPTGPLLRTGTALVRRAVELLRERPRERRFCWQDAGANAWHRVHLVPLEGGAMLAERLAAPPHGLTARELEVLSLVVAGRSNAAIAAELVVAPRTVATHVEHLLAKLDCGSRTACAALAVREGLLLER